MSVPCWTADRRQIEHEVGDDRAEAATDHLGGDVGHGVAGGDVAVAAVDEGDDGVEVGTGHGAEHPDQRDERASRGGGVLEQLQADIVG